MPDDELWKEFVSPATTTPVCGLCGGFGVIRIYGLRSLAGHQVVPITKPCICPNGRDIKKLKENANNKETDAR